MKKFQFTLSKLLDYKEKLLDKEKNVLAALRAEFFSLQDKLKMLEDAFLEIDLKFKRKAQKGISKCEIQGFHFQLENIRMQKKILESEIKLLEDEIERQLSTVIAHTKEVSELESLKEHQLEEYNKQVAKAEENMIAEFIVSKVARQNLY